MLLQDRNNLFFRMPLALHRLVLSYRPDSNSSWINSRGQRQRQSYAALGNELNQKWKLYLSSNKRSDSLVQAANINAISMFAPLLDQFPFLGEVDSKQCNFILTVAGVFMAATRLNNLRLGDVWEQRLMEKVSEQLTKWDPT